MGRAAGFTWHGPSYSVGAPMRFRPSPAVLILSMTPSLAVQAQSAQNYLANNTVLIVRHTEKPETGTGLTPQGEERARLYAKYFQPFQEDGLSIPVDSLYAGADSKSSF